VLFSQLSPFSLEPLFSSLERTRRLLTVEEGTRCLGWGAEVCATAFEKVEGIKVQRVAALDLPIANAKNLENATLPGMQDIVASALELVSR
jgi:pyruvate dehydrogenase E1 component beta subunit